MFQGNRKTTMTEQTIVLINAKVTHSFTNCSLACRNFEHEKVWKNELISFSWHTLQLIVGHVGAHIDIESRDVVHPVISIRSSLWNKTCIWQNRNQLVRISVGLGWWDAGEQSFSADEDIASTSNADGFLGNTSRACTTHHSNWKPVLLITSCIESLKYFVMLQRQRTWETDIGTMDWQFQEEWTSMSFKVFILVHAMRSLEEKK